MVCVILIHIGMHHEKKIFGKRSTRNRRCAPEISRVTVPRYIRFVDAYDKLKPIAAALGVHYSSTLRSTRLPPVPPPSPLLFTTASPCFFYCYRVDQDKDPWYTACPMEGCNKKVPRNEASDI